MTATDASTADGVAPPGFQEVMTSIELGDLLHVSQATLCRWRQTNRGPRVVWLSPRVPRYLWQDVRQWLERGRS